MRILITGGAGFIGRYFHETLTAQGHEPVIYDLVRPAWNFGKTRFIQGDVRDPDAVRAALQELAGGRILHLAAAHHDFGISHDTYYAVNETGAKVVCDSADALGIKDICSYSSVAVYGDAPYPHHEGAACHPLGPYGGSKLAGEKAFQAWVLKGAGRKSLIIRPTITFGPRNFANMYSLIRQVQSRKFVQVGPGNNIKSLSYVENIVEFTMHAWFREGRADFDVFNWVEKPDCTSREIAEQIMVSLGRKPGGFRIPLGLALAGALPFDAVIKLTGMNLPISTMRIKKFASTQTKFEADKARAIGFSPRVSLRDGIDKMVKWYMNEGREQKAVWHQPPEAIQRFER